jgi:hypothetical protein
MGHYILQTKRRCKRHTVCKAIPRVRAVTRLVNTLPQSVGVRIQGNANPNRRSWFDLLNAQRVRVANRPLAER